MVKLIIQDYKIVEKESTRLLLKTIKECQILHEAWSISSESTQKDIGVFIDKEIDMKLQICFKYYNQKYGVEIEEGYGVNKDIEINLGNICEKIKSWEDDNLI